MKWPDLFSPTVLAWFIAYLVVGVVMYGALFIAVGAACSDLRDTQTMLWPVMLLAMLPLFVWINVVREPTSTFSTVASFIPTATPMLMILRIAVPPGVGWWQPALGLALDARHHRCLRLCRWQNLSRRHSHAGQGRQLP